MATTPRYASHRPQPRPTDLPSSVALSPSRAPVSVLQAHHIVAAQQQLAEERQKKREQAAEDVKGVEVVKNGAIRERYRWTQELPELTMSIELPPGTSKRDVICKIGPLRLTAGVRGLPPLVEGELHVRVKADEAMWPCRTRTGWW